MTTTPPDKFAHLKDYKGDPYPIDEVLSEVGEGWRGIVLRLISQLTERGWHGKIGQIKEKFGGLRFYTSDLPDGAYELISQAENESLRTCDECGLPGVPRSGGWIVTRCDLHAPKGSKISDFPP